MLVTSALVAATNIPEAVYLTVVCSRQSEPPPSNNHTHCCHLHCPSPGLQAPPCVCAHPPHVSGSPAPQLHSPKSGQDSSVFETYTKPKWPRFQVS